MDPVKKNAGFATLSIQTTVTTEGRSYRFADTEIHTF